MSRKIGVRSKKGTKDKQENFSGKILDRGNWIFAVPHPLTLKELPNFTIVILRVQYFFDIFPSAGKLMKTRCIFVNKLISFIPIHCKAENFYYTACEYYADGQEKQCEEGGQEKQCEEDGQEKQCEGHEGIMP